MVGKGGTEAHEPASKNDHRGRGPRFNKRVLLAAEKRPGDGSVASAWEVWVAALSAKGEDPASQPPGLVKHPYRPLLHAVPSEFIPVQDSLSPRSENKTSDLVQVLPLRGYSLCCFAT
jgi:hypothetical protein